MRSFSLVFVVTLILTVTAVTSGGRAADLPSSEELEQLGLEVRWTSQAVLDVQRDKVAHVTNDENNIYVQSVGGLLSVFDAENGRKLWAQQVGPFGEPTLPAVSNKRMVIVCAGPSVYGYDKFSGMPLIEFRLKKQPSASPVMGDGVFYVPMAGGAIYAYSTGVLEHIFRYGELPEDVAIPHMWRFICNENIIYPPVLGDEALAFVSESGNLHSVNTTGLARGRSRFQLLLNDRATAAPALAANKSSSSILMLTGDNRVFSVDLIKGLVEWTYPMGRHMTRKPMIIGTSVFVTSADGTLTQFSRDGSSVDWGRPIEIPQYASPLYIGAGMQDAAVDQQLQDSLAATAQGVRLTTVVEGSPADTAGLRAGDILLSVNGLPTPSVDVAREILESMRLRVDVPFRIIRVESGIGMEETRFNRPVPVPGQDAITQGVAVIEVARDSPADAAGIQEGDIILQVGDTAVVSLESVDHLLAAGPIGGETTIKVLREYETLDLPLKLEIDAETEDTGAISLQQIKLRIPVQKWDVTGIKSVAAIGRFAVFGIDQTSRLVAFDRRTAEISGRVSILGYDVHLYNDITDQIYLISSSGEIVCLREIGPTVRLPELSPLSHRALIKSVKVRMDDPIEATGTVICEVELPDGTTQEVSTDSRGAVKRVYVSEGQIVAVGDPLILISDDKFATYHQRPEQQPVDVNLDDGNAAPANDGADNQ